MSEDGKATRFQRLLLPPIILQSVLIGGGYSTGREVVEYAGKHGPAGWASVAVIFVGFTLTAILVFELARVTRAYDYKSWIRQLIGPLWPLFDVVLLVMMMLVIAVMISAIGNILEETLGVPNTLGILLAFAVVAMLAWMGEETIERFKTIGTVLLYAGYAVFAGLVLAGSWDAVRESLAGGRAEVGLGPAVRSGVLYVGYNIAVFPVVLFCLHRQRSRADTVTSGILAGLLMTLPFAITWLCLMGFYPSEAVLGADVPWLAMLAGRGGAGVLALYGLVVAWTLVETSIGSVHALEDRVDKNLDDLPGFLSRRIERLSRAQRSAVAAAILLLALLLSRFGIIALVARGYGMMAYVFIAIMAVPLLTIGVVRIVRAGRTAEIGGEVGE